MGIFDRLFGKKSKESKVKYVGIEKKSEEKEETNNNKENYQE